METLANAPAWWWLTVSFLAGAAFGGFILNPAFALWERKERKQAEAERDRYRKAFRSGDGPGTVEVSREILQDLIRKPY